MSDHSISKMGSARPDQKHHRLLQPGVTCWRVERADRLAVIIDAADYFAHLRDAILAAEYSVLMLGWDFDARVQLTPDQADDHPDHIGELLTYAVRRRPLLHIHLLKWDLGVIYTLGRGGTPFTILRWLMSRRIHYRLDHKHPPLATHHQKIVVIDDLLAFCGGIDITAGRWDTRRHLDRDVRRTTPSGSLCDPWHDATVAVDGDVARALGELARERWQRATGEILPAPPTASPKTRQQRWPQNLAPDFRHLEVAIARTIPQHEDQSEVREIEQLYLQAIARAERIIYIESQYFACRKIAEALAERVAERDGPEVIVINPESADGYLEEAAMSSARAKLMRLMHGADSRDRFRLYYPVTAERKPIYVHAKIMIIDDWLLRVGSSNLNNRSMGFDTECDLAFEAPTDSGREQRAAILALRNSLLAEHLGVTAADIVSAHEGENSLIKGIESLIGPGRSLVRLEPEKLSDMEETLAESDLLDPERPPDLRRRLRRWLAGAPLR